MENPSNCDTCKHKQHPDGGWCYMFRDEPIEVCMIHSGRNARPLLPAGWTLTEDGKLRPPPGFVADAYMVPNK